VNKANDTTWHLLDVACEQTGAHVLFRGMVSFCADASSALVVGANKDETIEVLSSAGVKPAKGGAAADFVVFSDVVMEEAELADHLSRVGSIAPQAQFMFLRISDQIDREVVQRAVEAKCLGLLRYRRVPGGFAAAWIGPVSQVRRQMRDDLIGARIMILSDRPSATLTRIRLGVPLQFLADELNIALILRSFADFKFSDLQRADFFIAQRGAHRRAYSILDIVKRSGGAYIYEIDDLLTEIPKFLGHHSGLIENKNIISELLSKADLVTCTQENLRRRMLHLNRRAKVCSNYGDPYFLPKNRAVHDASAGALVTIMIAASDRVQVHFLMEALAQVLAAHLGRVNLVVVGPIGEEFRKYGIDAKCVDIIPHLEFTGFAAGLQNPIGVIPLDDSEFSSCKSAVKYFDYSVAGLATVCSNVSPYKEVIDNGINGLLVENTTEAWFAALDRLVTDGGLRADIANRAAKRVRELHGLDVAMDQWYDTVGTVLSKVRAARQAISRAGKIKLQFMCFLLALRSINHRRIESRRAARSGGAVT
jgi:glycosyltransferase involved in cell wall biosynthesis